MSDDTIELTVAADKVFDLVADPRTAARWHPAPSTRRDLST